MIECRSCKTEKSEDLFFKASKSKCYDKICKECKHRKMMERRHALKLFAIQFKGGKCSKCGYNKSVAALEFHHIDPTKKEFSITNDCRSKKRLQSELEKCILLCSNCHREEHERLRLVNIYPAPIPISTKWKVATDNLSHEYNK
jgi:hypothetical protein